MAEKVVTVTLDLFKIMEFMGWGYGINKYCRFTLPAGETLSITCMVPADEVWWLTFCMCGGYPSNTVLWSFETDRERHPPILIHEGWIGTPICPPGWHRIDRHITHIFQNVTGDPAYNPYAPQDLNIDLSLFIFMGFRRHVEKIERLVERFTTEEGI